MAKSQKSKIPVVETYSEEQKISETVQLIEDQEQTDIFLYSGDIDDFGRGQLMAAIGDTLSDTADKRKENALLILCTYGGDPDAAFKIANLFYDYSYEGFELLAPNFCKSAGSLVALGAKKIYMDIPSELGPLDIQLLKEDPFSRKSGLQFMDAINGLKQQMSDVYWHMILQTRNKIQFKHASETAKEITIGVFSPIFQQLNPHEIGSDFRSLHIAMEYGSRLQKLSGNLKQGNFTLNKLIRGYPSHGFTINFREAKTLFKRVARPSESMIDLISCLGSSKNYERFLNAAAKNPTVLSLSRQFNHKKPKKGTGHENASDETKSEQWSNGNNAEK